MNNGSRSTRRALLKAAATAGAAGSAGCVNVTTPADRVRATSPGNVEYFVGAGWLADHRDEVVVLDARQERFFRRERIRGARRVPLDGVTVQRETDEGRVPDVAAFAEALGILGLRPDDEIVVYGSSVGSRVTRTVFALLAAGHRGGVRILNGGLEAWNGRLGTGPSDGPNERTYDPEPADDLWVTREWLADRIATPEGIDIVDVRSPDAFLGEEPAEALDRQGHLPGAVNVHWLGNIDGASIRSPGELFSLYANRAELEDTGTVIVYGEENVDPTQTLVTLLAIGFEEVYLYDGGLTEWANVSGNHGRYPMETATDAVVDVEGAGTGTDGSDFTCN